MRREADTPPKAGSDWTGKQRADGWGFSAGFGAYIFTIGIPARDIKRKDGVILGVKRGKWGRAVMLDTQCIQILDPAE